MENNNIQWGTYYATSTCSLASIFIIMCQVFVTCIENYTAP